MKKIISSSDDHLHITILYYYENKVKVQKKCNTNYSIFTTTPHTQGDNK